MYSPVFLLLILTSLVSAAPHDFANSANHRPAMQRTRSLNFAPDSAAHFVAKRGGDLSYAGQGHAGQKLIRRRKRSSCQVGFNTTSTSTSVHHSTTSAIGDNGWANASSSMASETASATTSSTAASSTSSSSSGGGLTGILASLFPVSVSNKWTTSTESSSALSFSSALTPLTSGKLPTEGSAPDGSDSLIASFNAGQFSLKNGQGYSFYTEGNSVVDVTGAKEVLFSYSVFFPDGFQFVKGGKMPGLYGGTSLDAAKSCSGGRQDDRADCFSARLMWRTDGMGEAYNYFPTSATQPSNYCSWPPMSVCNPSYGDSIGRGSFYWSTGQWTTVAQRLKLNDAGVANGEQEVYVNGESKLSLTGIEMSVNSDTKIYGIMAQVFFGGSDDTWASPVDQQAYFKDWSLAIIS